ncbi:MAG: hypothetical protein AAF416_15595 [Pseudomonadota bacterium]
MTKLERQHLDAVASLGCIVCGNPEAQIHHRISGRYSQRRVNHFETMPLCREHHDLLHKNAERFEEEHGTEWELIGKTYARIMEVRANTVGDP